MNVISQSSSIKRRSNSEARDTCLHSCSDSSSGCDAQSLLSKVHHGYVAPLFGLDDVLIYFLEGDNQYTFLVDSLISIKAAWA